MFEAIASAEARVHGTTIDHIHFHEVGAIDSIVDIVGSAIALDLLGVDRFVSSPVPTGRGKVRIAHGLCAVPTPGTLELLKGIPLADSDVEFELTTPTGAALLKCVVDEFGPLPPVVVRSIGYGAGTKDFPDRANVLRVIVGEATSADASHRGDQDRVILLETNLDDVTAEVIGYTRTRLFFGRCARRVYDLDPDEEGSPGSAAVRHRATGPCRKTGDDPVPRDRNLWRPSPRDGSDDAATHPLSRANAVGRCRGKNRLATG